jgi:hypothetical protein
LKYKFFRTITPGLSAFLVHPAYRDSSHCTTTQDAILSTASSFALKQAAQIALPITFQAQPTSRNCHVVMKYTVTNTHEKTRFCFSRRDPIWIPWAAKG